MTILQKNFRISFFTVLLSVFAIVLFQSTLGGFGFHTEYSVSRYVGLTTASAAIFLLCNIVNFIILFPALKSIKKGFGFSIFWQILAITMLVALLALSICPVGLHDNIWGEFGIVSKIHRISASAMFISAVVLSALTMSKLKHHFPLIILFSAFIAYGALFVIGYGSGNPFIFDNMLFLESGFLLWFLFDFSLLPEN